MCLKYFTIKTEEHMGSEERERAGVDQQLEGWGI